ncbi:hypothetical protein Peur_032844 [Populus x canadensis]
MEAWSKRVTVKIQEEASPFKPERSEIARADFVWDSGDEVGGGGLLREEEDLKASICKEEEEAEAEEEE